MYLCFLWLLVILLLLSSVFSIPPEQLMLSRSFKTIFMICFCLYSLFFFFFFFSGMFSNSPVSVPSQLCILNCLEQSSYSTMIPLFRWEEQQIILVFWKLQLLNIDHFSFLLCSSCSAVLADRETSYSQFSKQISRYRMNS